MGTKYINVKGKSISYTEFGEGTPVVLLHGWPQSSYMWRKITPTIAQRFRVIMIDLPGLGESETFDEYDTAFIGVIIEDTLQTIGISNYHLVGHDIGAWVAVSMAIRLKGWMHRSHPRSLTVVDAGIPGLIPDEFFRPSNAQRVWQFYFHAVGDIPEILTKGKEREYLSWYFHNKAIVKKAITEQDIGYYTEQYSRPHAMSNGFEYYRAFSKSADQNRLFKQKLSIPVLAVGAEFAVGASVGMAMEKIATNVTTKVIANCGHYIPEERPNEFSTLLLEFIESH